MLHDLVLLIGALVPVFVLVAVGWGIRRVGLMGERGLDEFSKVVYWVLLPTQLFLAIGAVDVREHFDPRALAAAVAGFVLGLVGCWFATAGLGPAARGSIVSGVARPNAAFIGLPVVQLVAATMPAAEAKALITAYSVMLGAMVACFNVGAVIAFLLPHHGLGRAGLLRTLRELPRNPLIVASALGVVAGLIAPGELSGTVAGRTLELLAGAAIPSALLMTGMELDFHRLHRNTRLLALAATGKLVLVPAITFAVGWMLGLDRATLAAVVVMMACPVAMASAPMARMLGGDVELMAAFIITTTVAAPLTMLAWLLMLRF
jgi:predicted permease